MKHLKKIKVSKPEEMDSPMAGPSRHYYPPSFSIDSEQMPEIKNWKVGNTYRLEIEVVQKSLESNEKSTSARFDIVAYKNLGKPKSIDEMTDTEFEEYQGESLDKGELA